ncbi:unnamed protein product [Brugia pahangi]|uniref:DUF4817 domain-containing protein n=1 Tax=Brugia pahangi TaxID=6280 RepID=A0A0N4TA02_BRUPA|nr:unnamed protein product [Brugia pahangi]
MRRKFVDIANRTEFARAVAEYKKGFGIDSLEYPQLLPMVYSKTSGLSMPYSSASDSIVHHMGQSSSYSSMLIETSDVPDESTSLGLVLPPKNELLDVRIDADTANESSAMRNSNVTDVTVPPVSRNVTRNSNSQVDVCALQSRQLPVIDRSKKPLLEEKASSEKSFPLKSTPTMFGGAKLYGARLLKTNCSEYPNCTRQVTETTVMSKVYVGFIYTDFY